MAVRVTAAHTAEARTEAGQEAGEGGVAAAAAAALAPGGFLGLPAPFSEEGNRARRGRERPGWGRLSLAGGGPDGLSCWRDRPSQARFIADLTGPHGTSHSLPRAPRLPQTLRPNPGGAPITPVGPSAHPRILTCVQATGAVSVDLGDRLHCLPRPQASGPAPLCLPVSTGPCPPPRPLPLHLTGHWGPGRGVTGGSGRAGPRVFPAPEGRQQSPVLESCSQLCPRPASF